jgi:hypothetical protein
MTSASCRQEERRQRRRSAAAVLIQALVRGQLGRREARRRWLGLRAAPLQACWRGYSYRLRRARGFERDAPVLLQVNNARTSNAEETPHHAPGPALPPPPPPPRPRRGVEGWQGARV